MKPFKETQRFDQWWIKLILITVVIVTFVPLFFLFKENDAASNDAFIPVLIAVLVTVVSIVLLYLFRLETMIDAKGIHYQFFPFGKKSLTWQEISECYVREYSPLKEFGGWGIRWGWGFNGRAYNVKGNKGIQVVLKSGKKILFGTQKESEAKNVIESYKEHFS